MLKNFIVDVIEALVRGYRAVIMHARLPTQSIVKLESHLSLNLSGLLASAFLLVMARGLTGNSADIASSMVVNIALAFSAVFIVFAVSTFSILFGGKSVSDELIDRTITAVMFVWIISLITFIIDGLLYHLVRVGLRPSAQWGVRNILCGIYPSAEICGSQEDAVRWVLAVTVSIVACFILLIRSREMQTLSYVVRQNWLAIITLIAFNTISFRVLVFSRID